jgi:23S rRNA (adenine2030-N6)-methyltransferase
MNYQHAFHAGNFADVHKHIVLTRILAHLRIKPTAFRVIDSHAGAGRYDLFSAEALRGNEWQAAIGQVWQLLRPQAGEGVEGRSPKNKAGADVSTLLEPYLRTVAAYNSGDALRIYPGSPLIVQNLLRSYDRMIACETEPRTRAALQAALGADRRAKVLAIDGWIALRAHVPPKERRGLVLVDPPFEEGADFDRLSEAIAAAHRKWPNGIYMLWYPIKERSAPDALARRLRKAAVPRLMRSELWVRLPGPDAGLTGSGLIVINPPFQLDAELAALIPAVAQVLAPHGGHRLDWLAKES